MAKTRLRGRIAVAVLVGLLAAACKQTPTPPPSDTVQGWDAATRNGWYNADQGSRLMPLAWMRALEQPDAPAPASGGQPRLFLDNSYLATLGILPPRPGADLPIGFASDQIDDSGLVRTNLHWLAGVAPKNDPVPWVGLNCAACHTAQMSYNGQSYTVDGGPSLFDFQKFVEGVDKALAQTRDSAAPGADSGRWDRFASSVLGKSDNAGNRTNLLAALNQLIGWESQTQALNQAVSTQNRYGYGRVDAIGHIYNRILLFGGGQQFTPNAADAPVSYPHLWNITRETQVQWDGVATNGGLTLGVNPTDFGAMGRNSGEVLGVFGEVVIKPPSGLLSGLDSSINIGNLNAIEVSLRKLQSPEWPNAFGAPGHITTTDTAAAALSSDQVLQAGKALFDQNCAACHTPQAHYETMKTFAQLGPDNLTDEWMACNAWANSGASGALAGIPVNYVSGDKVPASAPVRLLLETTVKGALAGPKAAILTATTQNIFGVMPIPGGPKLALVTPLTPKQQKLQLCMRNAADPLMAYKARPLEGIWATAPYLHNGSVPSLYDLLLPPAQRPKTFAVGTRVFDPRKVGYDTNPATPGNTFTYDTSLPGNSNKGHVYGVAALTEVQRLELVEYLKTIQTPPLPAP